MLSVDSIVVSNFCSAALIAWDSGALYQEKLEVKFRSSRAATNH